MCDGEEKGGVCRSDSKKIFLVDWCMENDANALRIIRHEVAHAITADEQEHHGPRFNAIVWSLRRWNGLDSIFESE
jgi:hypothetical protein